MQNNFTFIFEPDAFPNGDVLFDAVKKLGFNYSFWQDDFLSDEHRIFLDSSIFHGSLETAKKISDFINDYNTSFFNEQCYERGYFEIEEEAFLNQKVATMTIRQACDGKKALKKVCDEEGNFFCRPRSCLKEFSGRILNKNNLTPASFDYGFYHNNMELEIECSPIKSIEEEYRFVVVNKKIITGSKYLGDGRKALDTITDEKHPAWLFASKQISHINLKDFCFVIDICKSEGEYKIVELNPFAGADLYNCNGEKLANAIMDYVNNECFLKCEISPCFLCNPNMADTIMYFRKIKNIIEGCYIAQPWLSNSKNYISDNLEKLSENYSAEFLKKLSQIDFSSWKKPNDYLMGCDGTMWSIELKLPNQNLKYLSLWQHFPDNFSELKKLFSEYFSFKK